MNNSADSVSVLNDVSAAKAREITCNAHSKHAANTAVDSAHHLTNMLGQLSPK